MRSTWCLGEVAAPSAGLDRINRLRTWTVKVALQQTWTYSSLLSLITVFASSISAAIGPYEQKRGLWGPQTIICKSISSNSFIKDSKLTASHSFRRRLRFVWIISKRCSWLSCLVQKWQMATWVWWKDVSILCSLPLRSSDPSEKLAGKCCSLSCVF